MSAKSGSVDVKRGQGKRRPAYRLLYGEALHRPPRQLTRPHQQPAYPHVRLSCPCSSSRLCLCPRLHPSCHRRAPHQVRRNRLAGRIQQPRERCADRGCYHSRTELVAALQAVHLEEDRTALEHPIECGLWLARGSNSADCWDPTGQSNQAGGLGRLVGHLEAEAVPDAVAVVDHTVGQNCPVAEEDSHDLW